MRQIFRMVVPIEYLFALLRKHCIETEKQFLFDMNAFRKIQYNEADKRVFQDAILPYYHVSKRFYVTRKFTYNSMANLIRQICKSNGVPFTKNLCYNHSKYIIVYYISKQLAPATTTPNNMSMNEAETEAEDDDVSVERDETSRLLA